MLSTDNKAINILLKTSFAEKHKPSLSKYAVINNIANSVL